MAIKETRMYVMTWQDYDGTDWRCRVVDTEAATDGRTETWECGAVPFVAQWDDNEDVMTPVRQGGGELCLVGTYATIDALKLTSSCRYRVIVEQMAGSLGVVSWLGWLKGEVLTQEYSGDKIEITLSCMDDVAACGCWNMSQKPFAVRGYEFSGSTEVTRLCTIVAELFARQNNAAGEGELRFRLATPDAVARPLWDWRAGVARGVFFELKDINDDDDEENEARIYDPMNQYDALAMMCESMGWSVRQDGLVISFQKVPAGSSYYSETYHNMYAGQLGSARYWGSEFSDMTVMGQHSISILPGMHKMGVKSQLTLPDVDLPDLEGLAVLNQEYKDVQLLYPYERDSDNEWKVYTFKLKHDFVSLQSWSLMLGDEMKVDPIWSDYQIAPAEGICVSPPPVDKKLGYAFCEVVKKDLFAKADYEDKKKYDYTTGICFAVGWPVLNAGPHSHPKSVIFPATERAKMPMVRYRCGTVSFASGALVINGRVDRVNTMYDRDMVVFISELPMSIRIGNKYYSYANKDWRVSDAPLLFQVPFEDGHGEYLTEATIAQSDVKDDPDFNDASGFVVKFDDMISGDLELTIYAPALAQESTQSFDFLLWTRFVLHDFELKYVPRVADLMRDNPDHYNYVAYSELWNDESKVVTAKLHSYRDRQASNGQLYEYGSYLANWTAIEKISDKRPEEWLKDRIVSLYDRSRKEVRLTLRRNDDARGENVWVDSNGKRWQPIGCVEMDYRSGVGEYLFVDL